VCLIPDKNHKKYLANFNARYYKKQKNIKNNQSCFQHPPARPIQTSKISVSAVSMRTLLKQNPEEITYQSSIRECYNINLTSCKPLCTAMTVALTP